MVYETHISDTGETRTTRGLSVHARALAVLLLFYLLVIRRPSQSINANGPFVPPARLARDLVPLPQRPNGVGRPPEGDTVLLNALTLTQPEPSPIPDGDEVEEEGEVNHEAAHWPAAADALREPPTDAQQQHHMRHSGATATSPPAPALRVLPLELSRASHDLHCAHCTVPTKDSVPAHAIHRTMQGQIGAMHARGTGTRHWKPSSALRSCCNAGGSWFGQCGAGLGYTWEQGVRACNLVHCQVCGVMHMSSGAVDSNCCYQGGSWGGECGPREAGWPFTWKEGFRVCNNITHAPEAQRRHDGSFVPLQPWVRQALGPPRFTWTDEATAEPVMRRAFMNVSTPIAAMPVLSRGTRHRAHLRGLGSGAVNGRRGRISRMRAYVITLRALGAANALARRLQRQLSAASAADAIPVSPVRGIQPKDALQVAGVAAERARATFGPQMDQSEFTSALGCTLGHLRAIGKALRDRASPALILEEDAVLDLQPYWPTPSLQLMVNALPGRWEAVQLAVVATGEEWREMRQAWRLAAHMLGGPHLLRNDFYWSSAAYLLHERGIERLVRLFRDAHVHSEGLIDGSNATASVSANGSAASKRPTTQLLHTHSVQPTASQPVSNAQSAIRWRLGTETVRCVKADACVVFPSLSPHRVFVATPPLFTCAEHAASSAIRGHDVGVQREVHVRSRLESLDFAAEARRLDDESSPYAAEAQNPERTSDDSRGDATDSAEHPSAAQQKPQLSGIAANCQAAGTHAWAEPLSGRVQTVPLPRDGMEHVHVLRRPGLRSQVVRLQLDSIEEANATDDWGSARMQPIADDGAAGADDAVGTIFVLIRAKRFERVGKWYASKSALLMQWDGALPSLSETEMEGNSNGSAAVPRASPRATASASPSNVPLAEVYCRRELHDGSYLYELAGQASELAGSGSTSFHERSMANATRESFAWGGSGGSGEHTEERSTVTPLLPPVAHPPEAMEAGAIGFRFWLHDDAAMWWRHYLQCTPDWDASLDSQSAAEIWMLSQLMVHPARTLSWREASLIVLPLLPMTSLHAGRCLDSDHASRLESAIEAMLRHPAYARHSGHDHALFFNYWDAWGALGGRGTQSHSSLANISLGWHETQDAAWGMANHRQVGKCQIAMPYVESAGCARRTTSELLAATRPVPLYFAGAAADFDTESGTDEKGALRCPHVARHAVAVRRALMSIGQHQPQPSIQINGAASSTLTGSVLRSVQHNMRACGGSPACEARLKTTASHEYARSQICAVAAGDTPSTGRLYDAIACLCVPLIITDDVQLPFPRAAHAPKSDMYGIRVSEESFLAHPAQTVGRELLNLTRLAALRTGLVHAREKLAYRSRNSLVATFALREMWASCVQTQLSSARPRSTVAKC